MPETNFFWDPLLDNILQERDETGTVTAEYSTEPGLYGNLISQNQQGVKNQYHFDALGSTLALTNSAGTVTDTSAYSAFGEVSEQTGSTVHPFQFVGQQGYYRDGESGHCCVRRRPVLTSLGRWLSKDPMTFGEIVSHAYIYSRNSPLKYYDPAGLEEHNIRFPFGKTRIRCECHCGIYLTRPEWIEIDCGGIAKNCCDRACRERRTNEGFFGLWDDWRRCHFRPMYGRFEVVGAIPDTGQDADADTCGDDFWDRGYIDCWACCTKSYEFWKTVEAGTACLAFRVKKPHIQPGQRPTQTWLYYLRRRLPRGMRPRLVAVRTVGKLSLYVFIIEGCYDASVVLTCATLCAAR